MSQASRPAIARAISAASGSLGAIIDANQIWSVNHPQYKAYTDLLSTKLREISDREKERKSHATATVLTVALNPEEQTRLTSSYPEFAIRFFSTSTVVHAYWVASRRMANMWMAKIMEKYTDRYIHVGGNVFQHMIQTNRNVHIEIDPVSPVAVHEAHEMAVTAYRLCSRVATLQGILGRPVDSRAYSDYVHGSAWSICRSGNLCSHQAEGMIFDATVTAVSPVQVCAAMAQAGAAVAFVAIPYNPAMLVNDQGEFPGTGVSFIKKAEGYMFAYPEGVSGVSWYPISAYSAWLTEHIVPYGRKGEKEYHVELLKVRENFLFLRVTLVETSISVPKRKIHALELPRFLE